MPRVGVHVVWEVRGRYIFRIYSSVIALIMHYCWGVNLGNIDSLLGPRLMHWDLGSSPVFTVRNRVY